MRVMGPMGTRWRPKAMGIHGFAWGVPLVPLVAFFSAPGSHPGSHSHKVTPSSSPGGWFVARGGGSLAKRDLRDTRDIRAAGASGGETQGTRKKTRIQRQRRGTIPAWGNAPGTGVRRKQILAGSVSVRVCLCLSVCPCEFAAPKVEQTFLSVILEFNPCQAGLAPLKAARPQYSHSLAASANACRQAGSPAKK